MNKLTDTNGNELWVEPRSMVVWWNPLTWCNWLDRRWDLMRSHRHISGCYHVATYWGRRAAENALRAWGGDHGD